MKSASKEEQYVALVGNKLYILGYKIPPIKKRRCHAHIWAIGLNLQLVKVKISFERDLISQ